MTKLTQSGNSKLGPNIRMFNLPASPSICSMTCPGCYAHREQTRFPSVLDARTVRYDASLSPDFAQRIISELGSLRNLPPYFRVHASGDFYSQTYIDSWVSIAQAFPTVTFYTYTKRLKHFDFSILSSLPNFILINSLHFGSLNYGPVSTAPSGAFICPSSQGATCGQSCLYCMSKLAQSNSVFFPKH